MLPCCQFDIARRVHTFWDALSWSRNTMNRSHSIDYTWRSHSNLGPIICSCNWTVLEYSLDPVRKAAGSECSNRTHASLFRLPDLLQLNKGFFFFCISTFPVLNANYSCLKCLWLQFSHTAIIKCQPSKIVFFYMLHIACERDVSWCLLTRKWVAFKRERFVYKNTTMKQDA